MEPFISAITEGPKMIDIFDKFKVGKARNPAPLPSYHNFIQNGPQLLLQSNFCRFKVLADYMGGILVTNPLAAETCLTEK